MNGTTQQTANFNISGNGLVGGKVGIGTAAPIAVLTVGTPLGGSAPSMVMTTYAGQLASAAGSELALASIGFTASSNTPMLGIRAYRTDATTTGWPSTAIGLGMDVDNSVRAGAALWLHANTNVGIGTNAPRAKLEVAGGIQTTYSGSTVITLVPNAFNTITHNLNLPYADYQQLIFTNNGDYPSNPTMIAGIEFGTITANSFRFYAVGGSASLARITWMITIRVLP